MKRIEFSGAPGSPYTRKMIAALRYRHIPYSVFWGNGELPDGYPKPKVGLLPTFYFPDDEDGGLIAVTDSTPIIRRLENDYPERSIIPTDPVLKFLNELIEDYGDEWLTKVMFHYRWAFETDAKNAAPLLVYWATSTIPDDQAKQLAAGFSKRQIDRLYVVGSNEITAETIESSYARLIKILDELIQKKGFILGGRPSSADFAIYGQLTQIAVIEPTSAAIINRRSPRLRAWIDRMEDMSGWCPQDDAWFTAEEAVAALAPLLQEIGRTYAPAMIANAQAIMAGAETFETEIDGKTWTQPIFKYQAKCLSALRSDHAGLSDNDRGAVDSMLAGSGCEALFA